MVVTDFAEVGGVTVIFTVEFVHLYRCSYTGLYSSFERTSTGNLLCCMFILICAIDFINFWNMMVYCSCSEVSQII